MTTLTDQELRDLWRSVQGPRAELTGPLIRYAHLVRKAVEADCESKLNWVRAQRDVAEAKLSPAESPVSLGEPDPPACQGDCVV